jgi:hypothetical protein
MKKMYPMFNEAGTHPTGKIARIAEAVFGTGLLLKKGTAAGSVVVTTAATENPLCISIVPPDAIGDNVSVELLTAPGTKTGKLAASGATDGDLLVPAAGGTVQTVPAANGTYYVCARALQTGVEGDIIEIETFAPRPVVISG